MISSLSATPIAPVPAQPIEEEHEDDVVLWRPIDSSPESDNSSSESNIAEESEASDAPQEQDIEESVQELSESELVYSDTDDVEDHAPTTDSEATAFDILLPTQDSGDEDVSEFETDLVEETYLDTNDSVIWDTNEQVISTPNTEIETGEDYASVEFFDEPDIVDDEDTSPQVVVASLLDEDTQNHINVELTEPPADTMSNEDREAFENAQTAMIPAEESPMMPTPTQAHPRPAEPVPEPTPLPLLSSMDTEPKVVIPEVPPIPPAPFTSPPPLPAAQPQSSFPVQVWQNQPSNYWLQQRMQAYLYGGYQIREQRPTETTLAYGKSLGFFWWVVAVMSVVGLLWYLFILILSGFRKDIVYIYLEHDGYIYEEGPGAAHVRRRRSRVARRWGVIGILLAIFSTFTIIIMAISVAILMNRYDAELASAYPEFSFIQGNVNTDNLDNTQVQNVKVVVPVIIVMSGLAMVGFIGGLAMSVISYLHSAAYSVEVAPLPDLR
jgi:hypothetical protein